MRATARPAARLIRHRSAMLRPVRSTSSALRTGTNTSNRFGGHSGITTSVADSPSGGNGGNGNRSSFSGSIANRGSGSRPSNPSRSGRRTFTPPQSGRNRGETGNNPQRGMRFGLVRKSSGFERIRFRIAGIKPRLTARIAAITRRGSSSRGGSQTPRIQTPVLRLI